MKKGTIIALIIAFIVVVGGIVWWQASTMPAATPAPAPVPSAPATNTNTVSQTPPAAVPPAVSMVVLNTDPKLGAHLTDNNGRALYVFAKDADGKSVCTGACQSIWQPFYLAKVAIGPGLDMGDFRTITRPDGSIQTTYYNWPLYYYAGDSAAGDVKGEGFNKLWFVAKPNYTVVFAFKNNVNYLVDADTGLTLYQYSKDAAGVSNCSGACIKNWPAFSVTKIIAPSFLDATKFSTIVRSDKTKQTAFNKLPLYHFIQDKVQGDQTGQGVNNFSIVNPF